MPQRFFTSDLHIRHDLVGRERGYWSEALGAVDHDSHERDLARNWDSVVRPDDHVFILGDIAMNPKKGAFDFIDARPGIKHLIAGNHDAVAAFHSSALKAQKEWLTHFATIHDFLQIKFGQRRVLLSHYPYEGEGDREEPDRHTQFRLRDEGQPLIHGHIHSRETAHGHQFHVGLDAWGLQLVREDTVQAWLDTLPQ